MRRGFSCPRAWIVCVVLCCCAMVATGQTISPSPFWKNTIEFPYDRFSARGTSKESIKWIKFTILLEPHDPNVVYFQDSRQFVFHYSFATEVLDPFLGMSPQQFNAVSLFEEGQRAVLGTVILPPATGWPPEPKFQEYGIQFVRREPYTREQIRDMFHRVKAGVAAGPDARAFYFPTYEQQPVADAHRDWFASQGIPVSSTARWAEGNTCYAEGWALGRLKFFPADGIAEAYRVGLLGPADILLTDGVPAEVPFVGGILSLAPSTPNSHVAILARTYGVPFVHLALSEDADRAQQLIEHRVIFSVYGDEYGACNMRLIDTDALLDDATVGQILDMKKPLPLAIAPIASPGVTALSAEDLLPSDIRHVGGKAANFGILRQAIPEHSPYAVALSFDLWNAFLDQPLPSTSMVRLGPGEHMLLWADGDGEQGPSHLGFRLNRGGESIAVFDADGRTLIDVVHFGPQIEDVAYGRSTDGGDTWQSLVTPTPGQPNSGGSPVNGKGLVINEFMADNGTTIEDPGEPGEYPDWIELFNASDETITLSGLYMTDDINQPAKWQLFPVLTDRESLREEIAHRLSAYDSYPPPDMQTLAGDLAFIRSLFRQTHVARFHEDLRSAVIAVLTDPAHGFDPQARLRFRSSTNVEDSDDFIGAGLYDSFSGCLADDLADNDGGRSRCDLDRDSPRTIFGAIRRVYASFYNENAFLERLRHDVNEAEVGMAVLVHHSFPDDIELANGVATLEYLGPDRNSTITLVTQQGAVSVTNPEDESSPEEVIVEILPSGSIVPPRLRQPSSLLPLGAYVMEWRQDYTRLADLLLRVSEAFRAVTGETRYVLDLEYKKVAPGGTVLPEGGLVVKQVRQLPSPDDAATVTPFLIEQDPQEFQVYTGEFELFEQTDVFADHRLKSRWRLKTYSLPLDGATLSERLYESMELEYVDNGEVRTSPGQPQMDQSFDGQTVTVQWQSPHGGEQRTYELRTTRIPTAVSPAENPLLTLADLGTPAYNLPYRCLTLEVTYDSPVLSWHQQLWPGDAPSNLDTTLRDRVHLWRCPPPHPDDVYRERSLTSDGISISTAFYFPPPPQEYPTWDAHTAPLKRWGHTTIQGLTDEPCHLEGYYSQTYRPEHHNLIEHFLFEPRLEPGISPKVLIQLEAANIRLIHMITDNRPGGDQSQIRTYGFNR